MIKAEKRINQKAVKRNLIKRSKGEKVFNVFNYIFFICLSIIMLYPFWHIVMVSFSEISETAKGGIFLYPKGFNLDTYVSVFKNPMIYSGFFTTITVTAAGTALGTLITAMTAYPLSKLRLRGGSVFLVFVLFTMLFNGGMIPNYLLIKELNLMNNRWSLILPMLVNAYNVIIMKSFFGTIPESLEDSAKIDGANDVTVFFKIILPLSKATVATIALFNAVMYWNDFFSTVLYINDTARWSLQAVLRNMLTNTQQAMQQAGVSVMVSGNVNAETIKAGSIVVATVPILIIYPFLQKYFVKGVMIGGVKG